MKFRTNEEIDAQLEARLAEMQRTALLPSTLRPCKTCVHNGPYNRVHCYNPLIMGFDRKPKKSAHTEPRFDSQGPYYWMDQQLALCGPEKALWEPRLNWWQRIWRRMFERVNAVRDYIGIMYQLQERECGL